ncbi:MAG: SDR family NAD(P)-dependent oxidoreductase [Moorea sp. SIO4G2]|uniref:Short-chain dehydrogenase/reductase n=1 Tax=Moorena bouillonii PNG TaxID=568701 RepID=A0A1U7N7A5_9CYAN|nr:oxidoreductase [Moorena bouillonii]NEO61543.1 SDR family NAD(P)-dependent oxidoreductase [Moorena sp. SIO4G2]NEQ79745.1 SDR family NAD(P)-dependent oxidoreductase [Moorena sp. SIO2I5]OLT61833.1 short-chain dehydrogenase/reductase [Moorena bouillonii PNG]
MANGKSKVALITGASSGMGKEMAKSLLKDGLTVVVAARSVEKMANLRELGAHPLRMDITDEASIQAAVNEIQDTYGKVDVLVNNAGFGCYGTVEETSIDDARYQFEVNIFGLARLTQLLLPKMREARSGKIINISSMGGKMYTPLGAWYHASKHALEGWSDCLRLELAAFNIDVVIIEPGIIRTAFGNVLMGPMLERSGNGPYAKLANSVAKATEKSYNSGSGSSSKVIADIVSKAVIARKPKTRYVAGQFAAPMIFIRKWFGDRIFDWVIMSRVK